jgi:hypothetical protein
VTVRRAGQTILLAGDCPLEEAEILLRLLVEVPGATVDWSACSGTHTAIVQVLLAAGKKPEGTPRNPVLAGVIAPALLRVENLR